MISRIWHGYTTKNNADAYEKLLEQEIFPEIKNKSNKNYKSIQLLRRDLEHEVEFITIMQFKNIEAVKAFVGEDYQTAHVPEKARKLLSRFDQQSAHYELRQDLNYNSW